MGTSTAATQSRKVFNFQKIQCLSSIDNSRKGSIDDAIVDLITFINKQPDYFTLSSCSGRVCVFEEENNLTKKKGCKWLYVTHEQCNANQVVESLRQSTSDAHLKFEAFILHIQCFDIHAAQVLHSVAMMAGFRNSGISIGKKGKIVVAVRSTHGLEVPLTHKGVLIVSEQYIDHICTLANERLEENLRRIQKFYSICCATVKTELSVKKKHKPADGQKSSQIASSDKKSSPSVKTVCPDRPVVESILMEDNLTHLFTEYTNQ